MTWQSTIEMATSGKLMFTGGDQKQLGAEFIFDKDGQPTFAVSQTCPFFLSRMVYSVRLIIIFFVSTASNV